MKPRLLLAIIFSFAYTVSSHTMDSQTNQQANMPATTQQLSQPLLNPAQRTALLPTNPNTTSGSRRIVRPMSDALRATLLPGHTKENTNNVTVTQERLDVPYQRHDNIVLAQAYHNHITAIIKDTDDANGINPKKNNFRSIEHDASLSPKRLKVSPSETE